MHTLKNIIILLLVCYTFAFSQDSTNVDAEKMLRKNEMNRYASMVHSQQTSNSGQNIDVTYYSLDLNITTSPHRIQGKVNIKAKATQDGVSAITLDLMNALTIDSVLMNSVSVGFTQLSSSFNVTLDATYNTNDPMSLDIYYQGVPGSSGFGSFEFSTHSGTPWVWSLSEPYGAKDWWPCKDHPSDKADSADISVRCLSTYKVGSNGKLLSVMNNGDGTSTHHWKEQYPISTYLISVTITNFSSFSNWFHYSSADSMEVLNYVLPEHLASAQANLPRTVAMLQIYSDLFGLYPFINEKYGHSEFGWGGGMEHQTMTSLGGFGENLVAHELGHQWFGDMITCKTWSNIWLNEGFATYLTALYQEKQYGTNSYINYMASQLSSAKTAVGSVFVRDTNNINILFNSALVYAKGATVLHMLRHVLGDTLFFQSMYHYANNPSYKYGAATTEDFQSACETVSGMDLDYFFSEWVYGEKYPNYFLSWNVNAIDDGYIASVDINQTTGTTTPTFFTMPIDVKFSAAGWDTTVRVFNDQQGQSFSINLSHQATSVTLDPSNWILKSFSQSTSISPSGITMGIVYIGTTKTDSITMTNLGTSPLIISSVVSDYPMYTVTPSSGTVGEGENMKFYVTFTPTAEGLKLGHIIFTHNHGLPEQVNITGTGFYPRLNQSFSKYWNLVSAPLRPADPRKTSVFSSAGSDAYKYSQTSGYSISDTIKNGVGYWLKFAQNTTITFSGNFRSSDTVAVKTGWNLIGALTYPLPVGSVISNPPGLLSSSFYGYSGGYNKSDTLKPSKGYWIKANQDGMLILDTLSTYRSRIKIK